MQSMTKDTKDACAQVDDMAPTKKMCTAIDDEMFCYSITTENDSNVIYSNLPGRFPVQLFTGKNYIFVAYIYKINAILIRSMKNRSDGSMIDAFKDIYEFL